MDSLFEGIKVICLLILTVLVVYLGVSEIKALEHDVRLLKGFLIATGTPNICPDPGQYSTTICHYTLQIKGHYEATEQKGEQTNLYRVAVPQQILKSAKDDCENLKRKPGYEDMVCPDSTTYPYREFVINVKGDVKKDEIWHFESDPIGKLLIAKEKVDLSKV